MSNTPILTPKYYYKDPLAATWMAKHFGMKFSNHVSLEIDVWTYDGKIDFSSNESPYYIHPSSINLLEPRDGDFCVYPAKRFGTSPDLDVIELVPQCWSEPKKYGLRYGVGYGIIQRNNMAFMWPEVEIC